MCLCNRTLALQVQGRVSEPQNAYKNHVGYRGACLKSKFWKGGEKIPEAHWSVRPCGCGCGGVIAPEE